MALLDKLSAKFDPGVVKQRKGSGGIMLDYLSIDTVINRLNDTLGLEWSFANLKTAFEPTKDGKWATIVSGDLIVHEGDSKKVASGVGGDVDRDLDKAIKTALAEAIKKAGHQLGIGLYLWDEEERKEIAKARKGAGSNDAPVEAF